MRALKAASVAGLVLAAGTYAAVQTSVRDPDERKASFSCWWYPERRAVVGWRFGSRPYRSDIVQDVTRNAPFGRKSTIKVGETVHVRITFGIGQRVAERGAGTACVIKAGTNVVPFSLEGLVNIDKTVIAA